MAQGIKIGIGIPTCREGLTNPTPFLTAQQIVAVSQMAEELGFDFISANDHLTASRALRARDTTPPNFYEVLVSLSYIAALTQRIKLLIGVIILPLRQPPLLTKQVATLDVFSGGRLILGVGIGSQRNELEAISPRQSKAHRGRMLEECIQALHLLFNQDEASFSGKYYEFHEVSMHPKPIQDPFPIHISGGHPDTARRVARWGNGWFTPGAPDLVRNRWEVLRPLLEEYDRDPKEISMTVTSGLSIARTHQEAVKKYNNSRLALRTRSRDMDAILAQSFIGTPAEIVDKIGQLKEAGATACMGQNLAASNYQEYAEMLQMFGEEVLPFFKTP